MPTEVKPRKLKVVFGVIDCATGKPVVGELPIEADDLFQLVAEFPPAGITFVPEDEREAWVSDYCSAAGSIAGKKIADMLKSLVLEK